MEMSGQVIDCLDLQLMTKHQPICRSVLTVFDTRTTSTRQWRAKLAHRNLAQDPSKLALVPSLLGCFS